MMASTFESKEEHENFIRIVGTFSVFLLKYTGWS
jgi:hypothetical protein